MINGKHYSWEDIAIGLPWGIAFEADSIDYDDELEKEVLYGRGASSTGYGTGKYKASAKITISREEFDKLTTYCKKKGSALYRIPPFTITVSYAENNKPTNTDYITGCSFTKTSSKLKSGDKSFSVDLDLIVTGKISRNSVDPI